MANLQVKGIDDDFYQALKNLAAEENRSVSQQVVRMLREHLAARPSRARLRTPAEVLLELAGSWEDDRPAEDIAETLRAARRNSSRLAGGL